MILKSDHISFLNNDSSYKKLVRNNIHHSNIITCVENIFSVVNV
jgi:hypothetical protein